jgi:hypothetical protein
LCDDPRIKAISFVGGDKAGKHIWDRAGANGKRVQVSFPHRRRILCVLSDEDVEDRSCLG